MLNLNKQIIRSLLLIVTIIPIASGLYGCTSGIKAGNGEAVRDESSIFLIFSRGEIRFSCDLSCAYSWGYTHTNDKSLYDQGRWKELVVEVSRVGYASVLSYFFLGRAAEELGYFDAALTYYQLAMSNGIEGDERFAHDDGFSFPADINNHIYYVQEQIKRRLIAASPMFAAKETSNIPSNETFRSTISAYSLNDIKKHIGIMLDGVKTNNAADINAGVTALNQIAHPTHGNRKQARAENVKGLAAIREGSFNEAVSLLSAAVKTDPADQEIIDNLSFALQKSSRFQESREAAECALSLAPTRASAWANLGTVLAQENKEESAVASFILAFRFSSNQQKTRDYFQGLVNGDAPSAVKQAAAKALNQFGIQ